MGVRFNAEKFHVGMYFTTPIFKFKMKCHLCPSYIYIQTDPKNAVYEILEGARKRVEEFDGKDIGLIVLPDEKEKQLLEQDSFYKLEHGIGDTNTRVKSAPEINQIQEFNNKYWNDPFTSSQIVRKKF